MNGHTSLNGAKSKACREALLVFEDGHTTMLVLQRTVHFLLRTREEGGREFIKHT